MAEVTIRYWAIFWDKEQEGQPVQKYVTYTDTVTVVVLAAEAARLATEVWQPCTDNSLKRFGFEYSKIEDYSVPVSSGTGTTEDKARLTFISNDTGDTFSISIPNPKAGMFLTDHETVNKGSGPGGDLVTDYENDGTTKSGNGTLKYQIGARQRRKGRKEGAGRFGAIG